MTAQQYVAFALVLLLAAYLLALWLIVSRRRRLRLRALRAALQRRKPDRGRVAGGSAGGSAG